MSRPCATRAACPIPIPYAPARSPRPPAPTASRCICARVAARRELPLNMEMAATEEMVALAERWKPHAVCLVPEKRQEVTTEGGLDAAKGGPKLKKLVHMLATARIRVSLFIDPDPAQVI